VKQADRVRATADAGDHGVRQRAAALHHLRARLTPDHRLQLAHDVGIGMAAHRRAEQIVGTLGIADPVAQRLIDGRAQGAITALDRHYGRTEQPHAADIRGLALHVERAHVHGARQPDARTGRRARDTVLARASLGHDALRAQPLREQRLAQRVIDLVRTGMRQILAFEIHPRAPALRQVQRGGQRGRSADPIAQLARELGLKPSIGEPATRAMLEPLVCPDQRLGYIAAAERSVATRGVGIAARQQFLERSGALNRGVHRRHDVAAPPFARRE
jgi:hypothetical protein